MVRPRTKAEESNGERARLSVTLPQGDYETLLHIAEEKKVSIAWVVRDAVEQYLAEESKGKRSGR